MVKRHLCASLTLAGLALVSGCCHPSHHACAPPPPASPCCAPAAPGYALETAPVPPAPAPIYAPPPGYTR
jgi:hypothetical protein